MNAHAILAAVAIALVGSANVDTCTTTQQSSAYVTLVSLLSPSTFNACATASGNSLMCSTDRPVREDVCLDRLPVPRHVDHLARPA
jgi:hypothetical protein